MGVLWVLLLLLLQGTICSTRQEKLTNLLAKFQETAPPQPQPLSTAPSNSQDKKIGRVIYPIGYGADASGANESSDAILNAVNDAFEVQKGLDLLPGVNDLGGVVIDFQGGNYKISKPIRFPASGGANVVVKSGTLRASNTFPGDRHLIELWSPNSNPVPQKSTVHLDQKQNGGVGIYYEDITFRDILFDSSFRGGGIFIIDSARIRINNCFFIHFSTDGILVHKGHETFISNCFLGQHPTVGGDPGERDFTGTAIDLASNDNAITDVAIFSAAIGVLLRGQANIVTGVHCYNKATYFGGVGILVRQGAALTRLDNCYLDYNAVVMEDPVQVHVTNGFFLGDGNVVLKSIGGKISGVNVVNCMFSGNPNNKVPIVSIDGRFSKIDQVVIDNNNVNGMSLKSTVGRLSVAGNGKKWVADFSPVLLFPDRIKHFQHSYLVQGTPAGSAVLVATSVSNNTVVVESNTVVNAVVSVVVDQYNMVGE
ncbi:Pectin lyase-like superfamily protein isoform 1 [Tripterygium wilfordii]|uniref:Pectin lyase-like superfamily protein isoform 1 n=1 Tax=Tripterygium wilfordii TaxID=458696 RepID=A0A7J7C4Z2_TRIWF|nr:polygalacturonase QRT3 [Tripterygium wilfordii]KAF5729229.1 Pectin lyase-like superfamily protein isoform 1 [Tripterygium wilfordii]